MIFTSYDNSILATLISYTGSAAVAFAVIALISGLGISVAIVCGAIGGLLMFLAKKISEKKAEQQERKGK